MSNDLVTSDESTKNRFVDFLILGLFFIPAPKGLALSSAGAMKPSK
jgi:hypothetical protein